LYKLTAFFGIYCLSLGAAFCPSLLWFYGPLPKKVEDAWLSNLCITLLQNREWPNRTERTSLISWVRTLSRLDQVLVKRSPILLFS